LEARLASLVTRGESWVSPPRFKLAAAAAAAAAVVVTGVEGPVSGAAALEVAGTGAGEAAAEAARPPC